MLFKPGERVFESSVMSFVEGLDNSLYSIPAFQREYKWGTQKKKIIDCLESIYKGFNLGSIIFWDSSIPTLKRKIHNFKDQTEGKISYIVDGQQRSLTLASIFTKSNIVDIDRDNIYILFLESNNKIEFQFGKPRNGVYLQLKTFIDKYMSKATRENVKWPEEWISYKYEKIGLFKQQLNEFADKLRVDKLIIGYKLSISDKDLSNAVSAFEKINAAGIKLQEFDILDAMAYAGKKEKLSSPRKELKDSGFKGITTSNGSKYSSEMIKIILNSFKLIKNFIFNEEGNPVFSTNAEAITNYNSDDWKIFESIFKWFKKFISSAFLNNVNSMKDIPYTHNVVMFIVLGHLGKGKWMTNASDQKDFAYRVMFMTGIQRSYDKSATQKLVKHLKIGYAQLESGSPVSFIDNNVIMEITESDILKTKYSSLSAMERAILIYLINMSRPIDYETGETVNYKGVFANKKNLDHIFPKSVYKSILTYDSLANIALVTAETNQTKLNQIPSKYFSSKNFSSNYEMYNSHEINESLYASLIEDEAEEFINNRATKMSTSITEEFIRLKS